MFCVSCEVISNICLVLIIYIGFCIENNHSGMKIVVDHERKCMPCYLKMVEKLPLGRFSVRPLIFSYKIFSFPLRETEFSYPYAFFLVLVLYLT